MTTYLRKVSQAPNEVEGTLHSNVVRCKRLSIIENQPLLVGMNALLVFNLGLDGVNRVSLLHDQRNGLAREPLDENLKI
jgi:hypothetical protein